MPEEKTPAPGQPESQPETRFTSRIAGRARVEAKVEFELDDATVFNLNRGGIKITMVTEN